jgi:hypothetical protein
MIQSPWAILLCKFKDNINEPYGPGLQRYQDLFTNTGVTQMNMVTYFRDMSHGVLDLSGSQVFGWYTLDKNRSEYVGSGVNQQGRKDLIQWARQAAIEDKEKLNEFFSVVVVMNVPTDLFGGLNGVVCDDGRNQFNGMSSLSPSLLGQEMGHAYGLSHSRADGSITDYMDPWDVMSTASAYMAPHPQFTERDVRSRPLFLVGPGLNAANMASVKWLDESRVWKSPSQSYDTIVQLRPLHRHDLPGFLAIRLAGYLIEFRNKEGWDGGINRPAVLIHHFFNNNSYLNSANNGQQDLVVGSVFGTAEPPSNSIGSVFTNTMRVEVVEINPNEQFAKIRIIHDPAFVEPSLGHGISLGGIDVGGDGLIFIGKKIIRVPPRSPLFEILEQVATYEISTSIASAQVRHAVQRESLSGIMAIAEDQMQKVQVFRQPTSALKIEHDESNKFVHNISSKVDKEKEGKK